MPNICTLSERIAEVAMVREHSLFCISQQEWSTQGCKSGSMKRCEIIQRLFLKSESVINSCKVCSKYDILKIIFRDIKVKKSEIRLKSDKLHPCPQHDVDAFV